MTAEILNIVTHSACGLGKKIEGKLKVPLALMKPVQ